MKKLRKWHSVSFRFFDLKILLESFLRSTELLWSMRGDCFTCYTFEIFCNRKEFVEINSLVSNYYHQKALEEECLD